MGWLGGREYGVVVDDRAKKEVEERREKPRSVGIDRASAVD